MAERPVRTVFITGASTGIGRATALWLAARGFRVFGSVRKAADGEALNAAGGASEHAIVPIVMDVTDVASIARAVREIEGALDGAPLGALVNNAGVGAGGPLESIDDASMRWIFEVNVFGLHNVTRAFMPLLRRGPGRVVHVGSVSGRVAMSFTGPYAASKFAVEALGEALRAEVARDGMRVSIIEPGAVQSEIWDKTLESTERVIADLPADQASHYAARLEERLEKMRTLSVKAVPANQVAKAVEKALTARWPKLRYSVGPDAKMAILMKGLLPARVWTLIQKKY